MPNLPPPLYALACFLLTCLVALLPAYLLPFYRRELASESQSRVSPLDGLRGILCFAVLYHHAAHTHEFLLTGIWNLSNSPILYPFGKASVALFFAVTGFLFWSRAIATQGHFPLFPFFRSRFFRIVPLYAFAALLVFLTLLPHLHLHDALTLLSKMARLGLATWPTVNNIDSSLVIAGVTWSLAYEWAFYLALPALALVIRAGKPLYVLLVFAAISALLGDGGLYTGRESYFLTGILAAHIARHPAWSARLRSPLLILPILAASAALPFAHSMYDRLAFLLLSTIFIPIACGNSLLSLLNLRPLRLLGLISYSVYLLHGILLYWSRPFLASSIQSPLHFWLKISLISLATLTLSLLTYRLIEHPFMSLDRRLRKGLRTEDLVKISAHLPLATATL